MSTTVVRPIRPITDAARLVALVASGILAGAVLAIWLLDVELGRSATLFTEYRQAVTGPLTSTLPPLGALAMLVIGPRATSGRRRPA
jgi:hypothetical protein